MPLTVKVDKIFLHEKEEKKVRTESHLGVRQSALLVNHARVACRQQPNSLATIFAVDEWMRADGASDPRSQCVTALVVRTCQCVTTTGPGLLDLPSV